MRFTKKNLSGISYSSKKRSGYELSSDYKKGHRYLVYDPGKSHHSAVRTKTKKNAEKQRRKMNYWTS